MGVSGSGKSTIGSMLATRLDLPYREADDYHPQANIDKMSAGSPLNDADRWPWLQAINKEAQVLAAASGGVISCSALKEIYRQKVMMDVDADIRWVYLEGSYPLILNRISLRDHFMQPILLQSQYDILEPPSYAIIVDVALTIDEIIDQIVLALAQ